MTLAIVCCVVTFVSLATALGALYVSWKFHISHLRADVDAYDRANRLNALIDSRVSERLVTTEVTRGTGTRVGPDGKAVPHATYGEQPGDPNVRTTAIVDEVHEYERDANRVRNDDLEYEKRDTFEQPPVEPMEIG
jgi:hypothetical protein